MNSDKVSPFTDILKKPNGARFLWADLHMHTPKWKGFKLPAGANTGDEDWKKEFAKEYVERAVAEGLSILGITEHNDVSWIDYIREAATEATGITIFPGFEIATRSGADGIHILCLFDPKTASKTLDGLLSQFGLLPDKRFTSAGDPRICTADMKSVIQGVKAEGGICVAAHVSSNNGLLHKSKGQIRSELFTDPDLLAVEIPKGRDELGNFE